MNTCDIICKHKKNIKRTIYASMHEYKKKQIKNQNIWKNGEIFDHLKTIKQKDRI